MLSPELSEEFRPGATLAGKYRMERVLGAGSMGVVCLATHVELEQQVALKFLLPGSAENTDRFLREARAAARLRSEHVVRVIDVAKTAEGRPYMVLEYLEGDDLDKVLDRTGALPVETAADYLVQACEGLAEAHAQGIVHRDLKPQNLFLTRGPGGDPLVKILDFGIAKMTDGAFDRSLTQTSSVMGSPVYMSPEQMRSGRDAVVASDVWALGIIFQELLTLQLPFNGGSLPELCLKVVGEAPRSPLEDVPTLPVGVVALIARCLEKDPNDRFEDAGALAGALRPFVSESMLPVADRAVQLTAGRRLHGAAWTAHSRPSPPASSAFGPSSQPGLAVGPAERSALSWRGVPASAPAPFADVPTMRTYEGADAAAPRPPAPSVSVIEPRAPSAVRPVAALAAFALMVFTAYFALRGGPLPPAGSPSRVSLTTEPTGSVSVTALSVLTPSLEANAAPSQPEPEPVTSAREAAVNVPKPRLRAPGTPGTATVGRQPPAGTPPPPKDEIPDLR